MKTIDAKQCTAIALGRLGENEYTLIRFDVSAWLEELPGAVIGLYNQRPGDADAYPIASIAVEDGVATWTVTSAELTKTGEGRCELVAIAGEIVAKSAIFRTIVFDALTGSGEAPEPWEEWQQQFIILKNEAEQAADRAEEAVEHYPRINNDVWEVWDSTTEQWISTGVQAQGPQGIQGEQGEPGPQGETGLQGEPGADGTTFTPAVSAEGVISWTNDGGKTNPQPVNIKGPQGNDGTSPTVSVADITGGHRVTVTDANGTRSFDVMDGEDYVLTAADKSEIAGIAADELQPTIAELNECKANKNGNYPDMTVGYADQLITTVCPTDKVPYLLRQSGGGVTVMDREVDKIVGGTVAWNQLVGASSETVTLTSGDRYAARISGVWSIGTSDGTEISVTGGADQVFDLTWMFGATIADYINTLETATHGAGVAWFRALFPKDYYAYDAGTLRSVQVSAHVMWDANDEIIGSYPLDSGLELRGIPKLDANNRLYYDGDEYESTGAVTRRYGVVDLGTITWFKTGLTFYALLSSHKVMASDGRLNAVCQTGREFYQMTGSANAKYIKTYDTIISSSAEFKATMSGVYLVYELATSTAETAAPYQNPQIVDASGTEQYIDAGNRDVEIPVGHETFYLGNLRKKIEEAPANPRADGDYILRRENGMNSYVAIPGTVTVSGTTPTITAMPGIQYVCGEVATLDITLPASGIFDVVFTSGSTATVLTATGITWPSWFDPTSLDANTVYEINVQDGLALVATWEVPTV